MKIKVTMKTPDPFQPALEDAARDGGSEALFDAIDETLGKWFTYGEYLTVEFDTDAKTATVLLAK